MPTEGGGEVFSQGRAKRGGGEEWGMARFGKERSVCHPLTISKGKGPVFTMKKKGKLDRAIGGKGRRERPDYLEGEKNS